jgi:nucleoside 2-deoxyribosyltransferase
MWNGKPLVYLSGMMDGVTTEEGNGWRKFAKEYLKEHGFEVFNPYEVGAETPNETFHNDKFFLDRADIVLVNLTIPEMIENKKIPFFTIGEMFLAHEHSKPIIAYTNCLDKRPGYQAIVTKTLPDLASCLEYIKMNYGT